MTFEDQVLLALTQALQDKRKHLRNPGSAAPPAAPPPQPRQTRPPSPRPTSMPEPGDLKYDDQQYRSLTNRQRAEIARGWFLLSRTELPGLKPVTPYPVPRDATPKQREIWQRIDMAHARLVLAHLYARRISPTRKWTHPEVIDLYFRRLYPWQYEQPQSSIPSVDRADQYQKPFDETKHRRVPAGTPEGGQFAETDHAEAAGDGDERPLIRRGSGSGSVTGTTGSGGGVLFQPPDRGLFTSRAGVAEYGGEFAAGLRQGFLDDGLKGTVTGISSLVTSLAKSIYDDPWRWVPVIGLVKRSYDDANTVLRNRETILAGVHVYQKLTGAILAAIATGDMDAIGDDPTFRMIARLVRPVFQKLELAVKTKLDSLDEPGGITAAQKQIGRLSGRLTGLLIYEVAEAYLTSLVADKLKAAKAAKASEKAKKLAQEIGHGADDVIVEIEKIIKICTENSCFAAGTPIQTLDGHRRIETLRPGDLILSRSEVGPDAPLEERPVELVFERSAAIVELRVGGETIRTTSAHPFYVLGRGWTRAVDLIEGQQLVGHDARTATIERIVQTEQIEPVYNIRVAEDHTYFLGTSDWKFSVWVHNACQIRVLADGTFELFDDIAKTTSKYGPEDLQKLVDTGKINADQMRKAIEQAKKATQRPTTSARGSGGQISSLEGSIPDAVKWKKNGGRIDYHSDGSITYSKNGISIKYDSIGYPDFSKYLYRGKDGLNEVSIRLSTEGSKATRRRADEIAANLNAGFKGGTPKGFTWHHHEDVGFMQLVDEDVHAEFWHRGGFSLNK